MNNYDNQFFEKLFTYSNEPIIIWDREYIITRFNSVFEKIIGNTGDSLIGKSIERIFSASSVNSIKQHINKIKFGEYVESLEIEITDKNGLVRILIWNLIPVSDTDDIKWDFIIAQGKDITECKQIKKLQRLSNRIIDTLNSGQDINNVLEKVLKLIRLKMNFSAVGIRFKDHDDFPYYAQYGFSDEFLQRENSLIHKNGDITEDKNGKPLLECYCGLVISEKNEPENSLYTEEGSFWTNDSYSLLKLPPGQDTRIFPRNTCIHHGFGSVAIIPIRAGGNIVGTLQLNEKKKGAFTLEMIYFIEGICSTIGSMLIRNQAEEALRVNEEKYRNLVETAQELVWKCDELGRLTYLNPAWERTHGYKVEEMLSKSFSAFQPPEVYIRDKVEFEKLMERGALKGYETIHMSKNGKELTLLFNAVPVFDNDGDIIGMQGTAIDITDRKRAERRIIESEQKFKSVLQSARDSIILVNENGDIVFWNHYAEKIFGYTENEVIGKPLILIMPERYRANHQSSFRKHVLTNQNQNIGKVIELHGLKKSGEEFPIELSMSQWSQGDKRIYCGIIRDITERKKAEEEQKNHIKKLSEIAFLQSHEVRAPIASILGLINLIDFENIADSKNVEIIHNLRKTAIMCDLIIKRIVDKTNEIDEFNKRI